MIERVRGLKERATMAGTNRWRKLMGVLCILLVLSSVAITLTLNVGPGPRLLARFFTRLADSHGVELSLESVQIVGWGRAALNGVEIHSRLATAVEGVTVERAVVTFDMKGLLSGTPLLRTLSHVRLDAPRIHFSAPVVDAERPEEGVAESAVSVDVGEAVSKGLDFELGPLSLTVRAGEVVWEGGEQGGTVRFDMEGTMGAHALDVHDFTIAAQMASAGQKAHMHGQAKVDWADAEAVLATLTGDLAEVVIGDHRYRLGVFEGSLRISDGAVHVDSFVGRRGEAHVSAGGRITADGAFYLDLAASDMTLESDLPFLAEYGFAGPASFDGRLSGTLDAWVLEGESSVGPGTIWGRSDVSGDGYLRITPDSLAFNGVRLYQYGGEYNLEGEWRFASLEHPGQLDLSLRTQSGRVQELLEIFEWQLPVAGRLYGNMRFFGSLDAITAEGDVEVLEAVAWDQPLDRVAGKFAWDDGAVSVEGVEVALATGTATVDGQVDVTQQAMDLRFSASDWPLGFTRMFEERLGHVIGGMVDVADGRLTGTFQAPQVAGAVHAEALRVGPTLFRSVAGGLSYSESRIELANLGGERAGGGHYTLSGSMDFGSIGAPGTDLQLEVDGERLRSLLQLAGEELPAALIDGLVSGSIRVTGNLDKPIADLDLLLKETFALKRGLRVGMRYADGALRVTGLELPQN